MPDVTSIYENDWGPEQTTVPPIGSIFILKLYGKDPSLLANTSEKYRLVSIDLSTRFMTLEKWWLGAWRGGYGWGLVDNPTFRLLKTDAANGLQVTWHKFSGASGSDNGCVCKRCNAGNPWASPNQADGTYLCYECR